MKVRVKLRFNKLTGEVEEFLVEDRDLPYLPEAEHNREHDRVAADIGHVLERHPRVTALGKLGAVESGRYHRYPAGGRGRREAGGVNGAFSRAI